MTGSTSTQPESRYNLKNIIKSVLGLAAISRGNRFTRIEDMNALLDRRSRPDKIRKFIH